MGSRRRLRGDLGSLRIHPAALRQVGGDPDHCTSQPGAGTTEAVVPLQQENEALHWVLVSNAALARSHGDPWQGPFVVQWVLGPETYEVQCSSRPTQMWCLHVNNL